MRPDQMVPIVVNGRTLVRTGSQAGRVCAICRKPRGCSAHVVQDDGGVMRSLFVHLPCLRKLLKENE